MSGKGWGDIDSFEYELHDTATADRTISLTHHRYFSLLEVTARCHIVFRQQMFGLM
jgi:hypothetical protein